MTEAPFEPSAEMRAADAHVTALLRGARARLRLTRMTRSVSITAPLAIAALALLGWARVADVAALFVGTAIAVAVAAVVAAVRTPSVPGVAELLDRRLRLADRVSTAVRMMPRADPVARFIVRDASASLTLDAVSSALPFELHARTTAAVAVSVACLALWAAPVSPPWSPEADGQTSGDGAGRAAAGSQSPARNTSPGAPAQDGGSDGRLPEPGAQAPAGSAADATRGRDERSERPDAADGRGAAESASRDERGAAGQPGSEANAAAGARAARPGPASAAGGRGTQQGAPGTCTRSGAWRGDGGPPGRVREGAGGVRGGGLSGNSGSPDPASVTPGTSTRVISAAALARARDVAEAAIAHDEVPPRHRAYVREYYRAVSRLSEP